MLTGQSTRHEGCAALRRAKFGVALARVIAILLGGGHFPPQRLCRTTFLPVRGRRVVEVDSACSGSPRSICLARLSNLGALVTVAEHDQGRRVVAVRKSGGTDVTLMKETTGFPGS